MTTTPPEEPQQPTPPPAPGYAPPPAPGYVPPPAPGYAPPPAPGYAPPPAPGYGPPPVYGASGPLLSDSDQRLWATLAHIGPIILGFIAPLIVWLVYKGRGQFVEEQAKEALNFQITLAIAGVAVFVISLITLGIGSILYLAFIAALVFMVMAAVAANKGQAYRYPLNWRIIK